MIRILNSLTLKDKTLTNSSDSLAASNGLQNRFSVLLHRNNHKLNYLVILRRLFERRAPGSMLMFFSAYKHPFNAIFSVELIHISLVGLVRWSSL